MKNQEYSVEVIGYENIVIATELESLEEAREIINDFKNDEDEDYCYDNRLDGLVDGGKIIIKRGNEVISSEPIYAYVVMLVSDDGEMKSIAWYINPDNAIKRAIDISEDIDYSRDGYDYAYVMCNGEDVCYYGIKREYEACIVCGGRQYDIEADSEKSQEAEEELVKDILEASDNMVGSLCAEDAYNNGALVNITSYGRIVNSWWIKAYNIVGVKNDGTEESIDYTLSKMYTKKVAKEAGESGEYSQIDIITK